MGDMADKLGLRASWIKTKIQNLGSSQLPLPLSIQNQTKEVVDDFCYLGSILSSDANANRGVMKRIGLAATVMKRLKSIWV